MSQTKKTKVNLILNFVGMVAIIVLVNVVASFFNKRIDLTEDNRYSLSENTVNLLENDELLNDRVFFKVYLEGDLPADMKNIRNGVKSLLDEFVAVAGDKIQYDFIDPDGSDDEEFNSAVKQNLFNEGNGILPTYLKTSDGQTSKAQTIWPGVIVEYGGLSADVIQLFDRQVIVIDENVRELVDNTINNLEYKFISSIRRVTHEKKKENRIFTRSW